MRKLLIAANFKMYKTISEAKEYMNRFLPLVKNVSDVDIVLAGQAILLPLMVELADGSNVEISAQNIHWEDEGAYTGELSSKTAKSFGLTYTILGHSERREYFGETDETVNKRLKNALKNGLKTIFCIGETLSERESGKTFEKVEKQVKEGFKDIAVEDLKNISIAYEPIWAIGTGVTATPEQAQEVHEYIRKLLSTIYSKEIADSFRILYGGSVKPENAKELMEKADIDGALVGGASLDPEKFHKIVLH
ncbi:triose-phosphate isomerase [bacterium]|nr:triose-phosphate isomerase [bacterium]